MYGIPAFRRQRQENQEFKLGYIGEFMISLSLVRSYLLKKDISLKVAEGFHWAATMQKPLGGS